MILVDTVVPFDGAIISEFDAIGGVIPFPGWGFLDAPQFSQPQRLADAIVDAI